VADLKGGRWGRPPPHWLQFFPKSLFRVKGLYRSLCAFAINDDGADKFSPPAPLSKLLDPPLQGEKNQVPS